MVRKLIIWRHDAIKKKGSNIIVVIGKIDVKSMTLSINDPYVDKSVVDIKIKCKGAATIPIRQVDKKIAREIVRRFNEFYESRQLKF